MYVYKIHTTYREFPDYTNDKGEIRRIILGWLGEFGPIGPRHHGTIALCNQSTSEKVHRGIC